MTDWLSGVFAVGSLQERNEFARKPGCRAHGWYTAQGHLVGAHSVLFHAPDSQLHGVLARQREIEQLLQEA